MMMKFAAVISRGSASATGLLDLSPASHLPAAGCIFVLRDKAPRRVFLMGTSNGH